MKLTAVIPTHNEQTFLKNCLKSVSFADEILVLDSGSTDNTLKIAKQLGARVIEYKWRGFRYSHQLGARKARGEWLLYLDADERISRQLKQEITQTLKHPKHQAYQIPRKNFIMGQPLRYGGWYPDLVTRLIQKEALIDWVGELHEYPQINGSTGRLTGEIYHLTHRGLEWMLQKTIRYTQASAQIMHQNHHPPVKVKNFFGAMAREFYYRAIKNQGFRDGFIGWLEIIYQTFNAFLIQVWLWQLQQSEDIATQYKNLDDKISREL